MIQPYAPGETLRTTLLNGHIVPGKICPEDGLVCLSATLLSALEAIAISTEFEQ